MAFHINIEAMQMQKLTSQQQTRNVTLDFNKFKNESSLNSRATAKK